MFVILDTLENWLYNSLFKHQLYPQLPESLIHFHMHEQGANKNSAKSFLKNFIDIFECFADSEILAELKSM